MLKGYMNKFNRGEVSEDVLTRDDIARIRDCAQTMQNFMPIRLGPMVYRPGTERVGPVKNQLYHRILPFIASADDMAILEISQTSAASQETLRVWVDDELVTRTASTTVITNGEFTTDLAGWTGASGLGGSTAWATGGGASLVGNGAGDWGILYQTVAATVGEETAIRITVADAPVYFAIGTGGANTANVYFTILRPGIHSFVFTPTVAGITFTLLNDKSYAAKVVSFVIEPAGTMEITMDMFPMTGNDPVIPSLQYEQSASVMFITSNGFSIAGTTAAPYLRVERAGRKSWSVCPVQLTDGPFNSINTTFVSLTPGATSGVTTLTSNINFFFDGAQGRLFKLDHAGTVGICRILSVTSYTVAEVQVLQEFGAITATFDWYQGRFAPNLPSPTAVAISEGRLWLGGADRVFGSVSDAYDSFDDTLVGDSAAITRSIGYGPVQRVNWLSEGDVLTAGLAIGEAAIRSSALAEGLTPTNTNIKGLSSYGSDDIGPMIVDSVTYFVQRAGKKIIGLSGGGSGTTFTGEDITVLHPEICAAGIARIAVTREPETRIYVALNSGEVRVYLMDRTEAVTAWSRIVLAGTAIVSDVLVLPEGAEDSVYLLVNRFLTPIVAGFALIPADEPGGVEGTVVALEQKLIIPPVPSMRSAFVRGTAMIAYDANGIFMEFDGWPLAPRLVEAYPARGTPLNASFQISTAGDKLFLPLNNSGTGTLGTDFYALPVPYTLRGALAKVDLGPTPYLDGYGNIGASGDELLYNRGVDEIYIYPLSIPWDPESYGAAQIDRDITGSIDGIAYRANWLFYNESKTVIKTVSANKEAGSYFPMFTVTLSTPNALTTYNVAGMVQYATSIASINGVAQYSGNTFTVVGDTGTVETVSSATGTITASYTADKVGSRVSGFCFSADGRYLYVAGAGTPSTLKLVARATLTVPFDLTNLTWGAQTDFGAVVSAVAFNDDGTRMYVRKVGTVQQYDLTVAWDPSGGIVSAGTYSQDSYHTDIKFSADGSKMFFARDITNQVGEVVLSTPWDVTSGGTQASTDVSAQTTTPVALCFSSDGSRMFVLGNDGTALYEYSLSTPWLISSRTYIGTNLSIPSNLGPELTLRKSVAFSAAGTRLFILGTRAGNYLSELFQFSAVASPVISDLTTVTPSWDPYSAVQLATKAQANNEVLGAGLFIKPDGLHLYSWSEAAGTIADYTMASANQLSTAGAAASTAYANISGQIMFDPDGLYIVAPVDTPSAGFARHTLAAPWTLAAPSVTDTLVLANMGVAFAMSDDGLHAYYFNTLDSTIRHLVLATAWTPSTAVQTESLDPANAEYWPAPAVTGLWITPGGGYLLVADSSLLVVRYTLATAFNLTGAEISSRSRNTFPVPYALGFSVEGEYLYTINSTIQQYGLRTEIALAEGGQIATGITIEKMSMFSESKGGSVSKHYDSHVFYNSAAPGTSLAGLDHLEAETVYLWSEGREYGPFVVSGGAIDSLVEYAYPIVGMRHDAEYLSNRLMDYVGANVMNEQKRVVDAGLILANAMLPAISLGADEDHMVTIPEVDYEFLDQTLVQDYDGRLITFDGTYETDPRIRVVATGPCTIKALTYNVDQPYDTPPESESP